MNQDIHDVAVIGAGPAGMMAAITAASKGKEVILIERNSSPGKKLLISGNGRCNLTNTAHFKEFLEKFGPRGTFLRTALSTFSNKDLMEFFESRNLELKTEGNGRVFPITDDSRSVLKVLDQSMKKNRVKMFYNTRVKSIKPSKNKGGSFRLKCEYNTDIFAKKVIMATGGASYGKLTGSTGDGFRIAEETGHGVTPIEPGIVPLKIKESWIKSLQGIILEDVKLTIKTSNSKMVLQGENMLFTHFGISGPLILDNSWKIIPLLEDNEKITMQIDLTPKKTWDGLESEFLEAFESHGKTDIKNYLKLMVTNRMIPIILKLTDVDPKTKINQLSRKNRNSIINILKAFPITITGHLPIEKAMITCGGVSKDYFDPNTMESRVVNGLYFAGELLQGCAPSGGFNLQQAFSTGYLAGLLKYKTKK